MFSKEITIGLLDSNFYANKMDILHLDDILEVDPSKETSFKNLSATLHSVNEYNVQNIKICRIDITFSAIQTKHVLTIQQSNSTDICFPRKSIIKVET